MRAALLPTTGDPFVVAYWLRNYATWRDEVDELVVLVNTPRGGDDLAYVRREFEEAGARVIVVDIALGHGGAIKRLMHETQAEYVVLCEEDAFVRRPGAVAHAFERIEAGHVDVIGSPRGEDFLETHLWPPYDPADPAEVTRNLWPCFLFARAADLRHTTQEFGDPRWNLGDDIPGLGPVTEVHCRLVGVADDRIHLDTFAGTTFELRGTGLRVELVHHVRLYDLAVSRHWLMDAPPWFHITGSTQLPHIVQFHTPAEILPDNGPGGGQWAKRLAWWERIVGVVEDAPGRNSYLGTFVTFREAVGVDDTGWSDVFDGYVTWDEAREAVAA